MKKNLLTIALLCALPWTGQAQTHLAGQRWVQLEAGSYDRVLPGLDSFNARVGLGRYYKRRQTESLLFLAVSHKQTRLVESGSGLTLNQRVPVEQIFVGYQFAPSLYWSAMRTLHVKVPLVAQFGYERIDRGRDTGPEAVGGQSRLLLGVGSGLEIEYRGLLLGVRENFNFLSRYEKFSTMPYVGYKIHLMP